MNDADQPHHDFDDEPIQFIDLDSEKGPQSRRIEQISALWHHSIATPWIRYSLSGSLLLILLGATLLPYYWPRIVAHMIPQRSTVSYGALQIIPASTAVVTIINPTPPVLPVLQQRPLHLPIVSPGSTCPTTSEDSSANANIDVVQADSPASAAGTITAHEILHFADAQHFATGTGNQGWGGRKVLWFINNSYQGPVLIRGHQLDGPHTIRFDNTLNEPPTAQLVVNVDMPDVSRNFRLMIFNSSYTRLQAPGCYAYQVDGSNFSEIIVFQAVVQN